ncbi:MAG: hypothetical protein EXS59_02155 [Candidatus Taylorbacteria bacterium]|nr:hypothetical protein [Candidatus Taylorbacteria bacterium]
MANSKQSAQAQRRGLNFQPSPSLQSNFQEKIFLKWMIEIASTFLQEKGKQMAAQAITVKLVDGEQVKLALDSVCNQNQVFVRMGKRLVAGVVQDPVWEGIYIWYEVNGVYVRLGDIVFKPQEDESVLWDMYAWTHGQEGFEQRAAEHLAKQCEFHRCSSSTGNHIQMLSIPPQNKE